MSRISVIIPNFQCARWLPLTIESCLQQKDYLKEIIIVDDYSTDDSWDILDRYRAQYPGIIKVYRNRVKGGNNARNYGFSLSEGQFIQWLDADDQLLPGKFSEQLKAFDKSDRVDVVYSDWQLNTYNAKGEIIQTEYKQNRQYADFLFELLINNWSPPNNYLIRRDMAEKLEKIGAWNPATTVLQDREYFTLAAIEGARFQYVAGNFSVYNRWSIQSVSNNKGKNDVALWTLLNEFRNKIDSNPDFTTPKKSLYRKVLTTTKLITMLSGKRVFLRSEDLKFKYIYWPLVKNGTTKLKLFFALTLNII